MKKVDFYIENVRYTGKLEDYTLPQLLEKANNQMDKRCDFTPAYTVNVSDEQVKENMLDGRIEVLDTYTSTPFKYAILKFSFVREEEEEEV